MMKRTILLLLTVFCLQSIYLQNGVLSGKIVDEVTGEDLIGVSIVVSGTTNGVATDIDGAYKLSLAPGVYDFQVSYISYEPKLLEKIEVKAGEVQSLNITLKPAVKELNVFNVQTTLSRENSTALVLEQKNSAVLFDGISADQMRRTPDRNSADVLRRVSGATIQDNSFVVIRGLPERYNAAYINGAPLPSSEPDRKAFAFDIFPSALLSDIKVIKTAMPSLTGEFAGGIIQIRTKDIPDKNYYNLSVGTSFNAVTTFSDFKYSSRGKTDFFGIDDGTRQLPSAFPTNQQLVTAQNNFDKPALVTYAKQLPNTYGVNTIKASPGLNFQFSMGHTINLVKKEKRETADFKSELGSVFALTYNYSNQYRKIERNDFDDNGKMLAFNDDQYNSNTSMGGIWNLAYLYSKKNGANNRISLKNMYNVNTNDQFIERNGQDIINGFDTRAYNMFYTQNNLFSTQLTGEHVLPLKNKIKFEWGGGYSNLNRIVPDYKQVEYRKASGDSTAVYSVPFSNTVQQSIASRFYSVQQDHIASGNFDFTLPFKIGSTRHELKAGTYLQYRDRDFSARVIGYTKYKSTAAMVPAISTYAIDSIFDARNMDPEGLMIKEVTRKSDAYRYKGTLVAGYLQLENAFFENKLKFIWGARIESFRQVLNTFKPADDSPINLDTNIIDVLPSINIIYGFHPKMNLRVSGSQTVCRPEARELAPFAFYDFSLFALVSGNSAIQRTKITNADIRYEYFPVGGQVISFTGFFKWFDNPIEKVLLPVGGNRYFTYTNVPSAYCWGFEVETKFTIASFMKNNKSRFLDNFSILGNFAYINSEVNLDSIAGINSRRPLQGQSPFIVNAGLQYSDTKWGFSTSLMFNYIGRRIFSVGDVTYGSIWENPRLVMDLTITKTFLKDKLELRLACRDLLAQPWIFYQDRDNNGSYDEKIDNTMIKQTLGQQVSFTVGYRF